MSAEIISLLVELGLQIMILHVSIALRQQPDIVLRMNLHHLCIRKGQTGHLNGKYITQCVRASGDWTAHQSGASFGSRWRWLVLVSLMLQDDQP
jgi:hypothetical protein